MSRLLQRRTLKMAVNFDAEKHQYTTESGEVLPSVTQIISPLNDFSAIDPEMLKNKARFGSQIHRMIELWCRNELEESSLSDVQMRYLEQFIKWVEDVSLPVADAIIEQPLESHRGFAGTPDIFILDSLLIDIKTRPANMVTDPIQLAGYQLLIDANYQKSKMTHYVLSLTESCYKFQKCSDRQAQAKFLYLLKHHKDEIEFNKNIKLWKGNK